jgi:hypothetical protein
MQAKIYVTSIRLIFHPCHYMQSCVEIVLQILEIDRSTCPHNVLHYVLPSINYKVG